MRDKIYSFKVIVLFSCLSIVGISLIPNLGIQLVPSRALPAIDVSYTWTDASAKIIEQEVTSKLEGVFNSIKGIKKISSYSNKGRGSISLEFKKNMGLESLRFEVSSLIKQVYSKLPAGVSYPMISVGGTDKNKSSILSYSISSNESPIQIKQYLEREFIPKIKRIHGISEIAVYGAVPYEWVITYDSKKLLQLDLSLKEIEVSINQYLLKQDLGIGVFSDKFRSKENIVSVSLSYLKDDKIIWKQIPIKRINNRILNLGSIATIRLKEANKNSYYRINGLNSVSLVIYAEKGVNTIDLATDIKTKIKNLKDQIQSEKRYLITLTKDTSEYISKELGKIKSRALLSFLILFLFIIIINRNLKYIIILFLGIFVNLSIAIIFYYIFKVELQLYSLAGITISFGIIIDNSIIMIDHVRKEGNKKVFLAILAGTLTTIAALSIVLFLEEDQSANLWDFAVIIAINTGVSLLVSYFYIPALLDKLDFEEKKLSPSKEKSTNYLLENYLKFILFFGKRKYRWIFLCLIIFGFGIPINLLPKKIKETNWFSNLYNETLGNDWFTKEVRPTLEKAVGGTFRLFTEHVYEDSFYNEPSRTSLDIRGVMPEGCTIKQLNEVILKLENYLSNFKEIELYETDIKGYRNSAIQIYFKKEYEDTDFPLVLKSRVESKVLSLGGLDWIVSGVGKGFSNQIGSSIKNNRIYLEGYNYDQLYHFAEQLKLLLVERYESRIQDIEISNGERYNEVLNEYYLNINEELLGLNAISPQEIYQNINRKVHSNKLLSIISKNDIQEVKSVSDTYESFDIWDLKNMPIQIGDKILKIKELASVKKKKTGNKIVKVDQQYRLMVGYNFIGTEKLSKNTRKQTINDFKDTLPIGYTVFDRFKSGWNKENKKQYYFLIVAVCIIFFVCSILLESLIQPLIILIMIPISFIGTFLTFYLFDFNFDQGGYASFILLTGISVNSALYIINDLNNLKIKFPNKNIQKLYLEAFDRKIVPIGLTIFSTIIGLLPFVWDGQKEAFWFSFAVGSIGGLLFSSLGILIYLPLFFNKKRITKPHTVSKLSLF